MAATNNTYYTPYLSDSESDTSDSEYDTDESLSTTSTSSTDSSEYATLVRPREPPNFKALAEGLSLSRISGDLNIDSSGTDLAFADLTLGFPVQKGGYPTFKNYEIQADPSGSLLKTSSQSVNSIVMLDSRDRDRAVFTQPTSLTLRLPRVYNNVTNFQVVQIKLLSAFYYFRRDKYNTDISILELNRTVQNATGQLIPNIIKSFIREGTYDINSLLSEITIQLNRTPIFYDFPNGFQDFAPRFAATGDFSLNFNFPGDTFYDSLLDQYIPNPTVTSIVTKYFQSQYAGLSSYTTDQIKVAYYYPVVKEILLDQDYPDALNLTITTSLPYLLPGETVRSRCIYTFQGLNDPVVLEVIANNITVLDNYRLRHTFRYSLINKYNVSYETQSNHVTISAPTLNTSLVNLINYKQTQFFAEQLNLEGITQAQYNSFQAQNTILLAVLNDLFYFIQRWLATYFGVPFNTYTLDYIADPQQLIPIRDAYNAIGVSSNYDAQVLARTTAPINTDILSPFKQPPPYYWNRLYDLSESTFAFPYNLETGNPATSSNYPYSVYLKQQDETRNYVDTNGYLYANQLTRYSDIVVPLEPTKYTVFKFKSPVRQTLQVETLPRPTEFRYPAYNALYYDLSAQKIFDNSYAFIENAQNSKMDVTANFAANFLECIPGFSTQRTTANFGVSYESSIAYWSNTYATVQPGNTIGYFDFYTPLPPAYSTINAAGYRFPMNITITSANNGSNFATPMNMYLYHDRAAFMADVSSNRLESQFNYITAVSTTTSVSTTTLQFNAYANQAYYLIARSQDLATATQNYRVVPWFPNGSTFTTLTSTLSNFDPFADPQSPQALSNFNYATVADPAYIRLPIQSSIQHSTSTDILFSTLSYSTVAIGYDASGVSTDLTDYCGFIGGQAQSNSVPNASLRMDPISGYIFQVDKGYNTTSQNYLATGSGNAILEPQGTGVYTPKTVAQRETTIAHWYGTSYLPNSENQTPMLSNQLANTSVIQPFTYATTTGPLEGYTYGGSNQAIQFGDGVYGLSFVPQQGVWDIERFMFKSVYTTSNASTDENLGIQYIGVYYSAITSNRFVHEITLADAICVLKFNKAVTYSSNYQNLGFDAAGGTYYEYVRDSNGWPTGSNAYLYGYSQIRQQANFDLNSIYSFIPFNGNGQFMTFQGLVGSPVPYPYYSDASAGLAYFDGQAPNTQKGIILPTIKASPDTTRGPPAGYDQTQSKYELSMPIGTNLLQYITPYPFALLSNTMYPWDPLPYAPSMIVGDVSGYIMTQDVFYRVFEYSADTTNYSLVEKYQFTLDQIWPSSNPNINFIGVAANESRYAFFAYSNVTAPPLPPSPVTSRLLIRTMVPATGEVEDTLEILNLPTFDPTTQQITNITYNNFGGFTMAIKQGASNCTALCKHNSSTSTMTLLNMTDLAGFNSNVDRLITRQSAKEGGGQFYIFPYRKTLAGPVTEGIIDYVNVISSNTIPIANPSYNYRAFVGDQDTWSLGTSPCFIQTFNLSNAANPTPAPFVYREPITSRNPYKDFVYLLSEADPQRFYQVLDFATSNSPAFTSNAIMLESRYQFPVATSNFTQGANGAKWSLIGNTLYGNRNDTVDSPRKINQAWQIFYPLQRIVLRQVAKNFTFMHNTEGLEYPEYPHTALIGYDSSGAITADTSKRWGLESPSNFTVADFTFSGRTFNSYLFTFPLQKSTASNPYYYLAVRNYSPTEKSQVLLRTSLTNRYDFGYVSMTDISNEILLTQTASNAYNPDYYASLLAFNSNFVIDSNGKIFGANVVQGYAGSNFSNVVSFGDFYGRFIKLYNQYNAQVQLVQTINSNVNTAVREFIEYDLQYILPATALNRQRFTDPLTYSILWRSALEPEYLKLEENWGLGWNLGYAKQDTPYETVHRAESFFKILDDFINLRLNPEFDMNRMDTSAKENLGLTLEPTGATKAFHGKLLLANFGSYAQTLISNPVSFFPPLGRIDKLTFQWVDITGAIINNADCEWNVVVQIVEKKDMTEIGQKPLVGGNLGL